PTEEAALVEPGEPGESGTPAEVVGVAASAGVDAAPAEPSDDEGSARDDATALSEPGLEAASEPEPEPELQSVPASTAVAPTEAQAGTAADADGSVAREAPPARGVTTEVAGEIDPDLLEVFLEEARDLLDHADGVLATWRADPEQTGYVDELRRDLHTLKGGARISGLVPVGDLAHAVETLLERGVPEQGRIGSLLDALETS